MGLIHIIEELCKAAFGLLIVAICIRAAYNMLKELTSLFWPTPQDTRKPATYRLKVTQVKAFQYLGQDEEMCKEAHMYSLMDKDRGKPHVHLLDGGWVVPKNGDWIVTKTKEDGKKHNFIVEASVFPKLYQLDDGE